MDIGCNADKRQEISKNASQKSIYTRTPISQGGGGGERGYYSEISVGVCRPVLQILPY